MWQNRSAMLVGGMKTYKHAVSVTSQVYFCSAPVRIDAYDTCQFGCVYCFSRIRSRQAAKPGIHSANPFALRRRFDRIRQGDIASALDEFRLQRVPVQLGGLQDPFTPRERQARVTLELLKVLRDESYPTLVSTKGSLFLEAEYLDLLAEMNVLFRISAAGVSESLRPLVDRMCDPFDKTLEKIATLSRRGIPVALRIQPIFPKFEATALEMAAKAAAAGVRQVTFEYLKLPSESTRQEIARANSELGYDVVATMSKMGLSKVGPDWTLTREAKRPFVRVALAHCRDLGIRFGAGDTEFIPWSDGDGCCGSSSFSLVGSHQFAANFVGAIKYALTTPSKRVEFAFLERQWSPHRSIGNYMDGRARISAVDRGDRTDWLALMARRWNPGPSPYSPAFFDGVVATDEKDAAGLTVYDATPLAEELRSLGNA
jgi:DNA repair photolyase